VNIKEYIESGIIESCVLGLATEAEQQEFEALYIQYPEIIEARRAFELALEAQLLKEAVAPAVHVKEKILKSLTTPITNGIHKKEKEYITPVRSMNIWKWIAAASILLLACTTWLAYSVNDKYQRLLTANIETANQLNYSSHVDAIMALKTIVDKPSVKWSTMVEPTNASHCAAHIYWDSLSKNTFLLLGNIPKPVANKQFQLWAVLNGHPVNLGIFDVKKEGQLIQMKNIQEANAFTITIEPRGGSETPNMKATYALGEL